MHIAIIESKLDGKGGSQRQALSLALELKKMGHAVKVYALACNKEACFPDMLNQLEIVCLPSVNRSLHKKPMKIFGPFNYMFYAREESRRARELAFHIDRNTDILNPHDRLGFRTAYYFKRLVKDIPAVLMMSDILTKGWMAWRRQQLNPALVPSLRKKLFNRIVDAYEVRKFIMPHEGIVTLDNRTKAWVDDYFGKKAVVVRSGLDIEKFPFVFHRAPSYQVKILMAGIFFIHRRYEDAIRAVKMLVDKHYDVYLSVAGIYARNSEYADYYRKLCDLVGELNLNDRVKFLGNISDEELLSQYHHNDIYVSPNHLQSWGLAVFEAMACGMPVIVSKTAGASEVLTDGKTGLLVNPKSPQEIANAIERLCGDFDLYATLSSSGREFVEKNISWKQYAQGMTRVFEDIMNQRKENTNSLLP